MGFFFCIYAISTKEWCAGRFDQYEQREGKGVRTPLSEKSHNIGFLSNTGPDPLKFSKLPSPQLMLGHHRQAT